MSSSRSKERKTLTSRRLLAIMLTLSFLISVFPSMKFLQSQRVSAAAPENHTVLTGSTMTIVHRVDGQLLKKKVEYLYTSDGTPVYCIKAASSAPTGGSLAVSVLTDSNAKALLKKIQYIIDYVNPGLNSSFENYAVKQLLVWKLVYEYESTLAASSKKWFHGVNLDACELDAGEITSQALRVVAKAQEIWASYNANGRPGNDMPGYYDPTYKAEILNPSSMTFDASSGKYVATFNVAVRETNTGFKSGNFTFTKINGGSVYAKDSSGNYSIAVSVGTEYASGTEFKFVGSWNQVKGGTRVEVYASSGSLPPRTMYGYFLDPNNEAKQSYVTAFTNANVKADGSGQSWSISDYMVTFDKVSVFSGNEVPEAGAEFQVWNSAYSSFAAAKADGVGFECISTSTGAVVDKATNASIKAPAGTYTIKQTVAPEGTEMMSPNPQNITVSNANAYKKLTDKMKDGSIIIRKKIETGADVYAGKTWAELAPEQGAQFQVWNTKYASYDAAPEAYRTLMTTDANGYAGSKRLPYGTYKVHQLPSATTYEVADFTFNITGSAPTSAEHEFNLTNKQYELKIQIRKVDQRTGDVVPAAGIEFEVLDSNKNVMKDWDGNSKFTTNADGTTSLEKLGLKVGTYYIHELKAPSGYVLTEDLVQFEAKKGETFIGVGPQGDMKAVDFADSSVSLELELVKTGDQLTSATEVDAGYSDLKGYEFGYGEVALKGATYELYCVNDVFDFERDIALLDTTKYPAYVTNDAGTTFTPYRMFDTDGDGTAETALKAGSYLGSYTTNADGKIVVGGLALDTVTGQSTYKFVETKAPNGYLVDTTPITYTFTDDRADQHVTVISHSDSVNDKKQNAELTFEKVARDYKYDATAKAYVASDRPLSGAVFGVYATNDITAYDGTVLVAADSLIEVVTSDDNGTCLTKADYPLGFDFYVKEIEAPEGYVLNDNAFPITVKADDGDNSTTKYTFKVDEPIINEISRACIEINKIADDTKLPMENVEFEVYTADGTLVETIVTDAQGKATTSFAFPYGDEITLRETKTHAFYDLAADEMIKLNVPQKDLANYGVQQVTIYNYLMSSIQIEKVTGDGNKTPMDGVTFQLWKYGEDGAADTLIAEEETDINGHLTFYAGQGKYYMKETSVGSWTQFMCLDEVIDVECEKVGKIMHYTVEDSYTSVLAEKRSAADGKLLGNCGISVRTPGGTALNFIWNSTLGGYVYCETAVEGSTQVLYTNNDESTMQFGSVQILGLPHGAYEIFEVEAPSGYRNDSEVIKIDVTEGQVLGVQRLYDSIKTSDIDMAIGIGLCSICAVSAIALFILAGVEFADIIKRRRKTGNA